MTPRGEAACILGALAVHGIFLVVAWKTPEPTYTFPVTPETQLVEIDLPKDIEKEDVATPRDTSPEPGMVAMRATEAARRDARGALPDGAVLPNSTATPDSEPPPTGPVAPPNEYEDAPPGTDKTWAMPGSPDAVRLYALKNGMPDTGPPPAAPTAAPPAKKVDRDKANEILSADVRERDKKLGLNLPAAGTIASVAKVAVRASDVPSESKGTIVVTLGPGGTVKSVRVGPISGGSSADWEAVAASVKASLSGQSLKLNGDYAKGAIVTINIQSKMQLPSGNKSGDPVSLGITKGGPGGTFDLADIGARPIRQVIAAFTVTPVK